MRTFRRDGRGAHCPMPHSPLSESAARGLRGRAMRKCRARRRVLPSCGYARGMLSVRSYITPHIQKEFQRQYMQLSAGLCPALLYHRIRNLAIEKPDESCTQIGFLRVCTAFVNLKADWGRLTQMNCLSQSCCSPLFGHEKTALITQGGFVLQTYSRFYIH